jgi:hypothetical protein
MRFFLAFVLLALWFDPALAQAASTTVTTTEPATISLGTIAGQVLTWLAAAFSVPIGTVLTAWLLRLFKVAGLDATKAMSDQLNATLVNGLNDAAANGASLATGKLPIAVKDPIVASAIQYAIDHQHDTLTALGLDPTDGNTVKVLRARIATLAADPSVPTPAILAVKAG